MVAVIEATNYSYEIHFWQNHIAIEFQAMKLNNAFACADKIHGMIFRLVYALLLAMCINIAAYFLLLRIICLKSNTS